MPTRPFPNMPHILAWTTYGLFTNITCIHGIGLMLDDIGYVDATPQCKPQLNTLELLRAELENCKMDHKWEIVVLAWIMSPWAQLTLLWPCVPGWVKDGNHCLICSNPWGPKGAWINDTRRYMAHPNYLILYMMEHVSMQKTLLHHVVQAIRCAMRNTWRFRVQPHPQGENELWGNTIQCTWPTMMNMFKLQGYLPNLAKEKITEAAFEFHPGAILY